MAAFKVYKLHFTSPLHISDNRSDYGVSLKSIQSDTMYAAVTSCLAKLGQTIPDDGDLGCTISSLFPFYQKDNSSQAVYFLPKPLRNSLPILRDISNAKKIKKVTWLDTEYFQKVINDESLFESEEDILAIKNKAYLTRREIADNFISSQVSPRVTVSRIGDEDAVPFYMDRVYFKDYSGLYFISDGDTHLFDEGLKLLQYEGIGTDRNIGNGFFEYDTDTIELRIPEQSSYSMSMSMYIPQSKEELNNVLSGNDVAYDFTRRGGWITDTPHNTIRKNVVYAFNPGSVLRLESNKSLKMGAIVNLKPDIQEEILTAKGIARIPHPIWRNGRSLFIPIKLK